MEELFYKSFAKKHGDIIFSKIEQQIKNEIDENKNTAFSNKYLEFVFEIALFDFWGLNDEQINKFFHDRFILNISVDEIKRLHKNSICEIQRYVKSVVMETDQ